MEEVIQAPVLAAEKKKERIGLAIFLFFATVFTTVLAGAFQAGASPLSHPLEIVKGIPFSFTLMAILLSHELGHFLAARHYHVDATLPYFIPAPPYPFIIGTFGAFIKMRSPILYKNALFDVAVAGPLAGFVLSCIALLIGVPLSEVSANPPQTRGMNPEIMIGSSPIFYFFVNQLIGSLPQGYYIEFHPIAFAGWLGLFVTCLNLIPIGQLDGGHLVYALFGKKHRAISTTAVVFLMLMGFLGWAGWWIWGLLGAFLGLQHPSLADHEIPLSKTRLVVGWITLLIFIGTFIPVPFY